MIVSGQGGTQTGIGVALQTWLYLIINISLKSNE